MKLQELALASSSKLTELNDDGEFDTESIMSSLNADFYEFVISDRTIVKKTIEDENEDTKNNNKKKK